MRLSSGQVLHGLNVEKMAILGHEPKLAVYPIFEIEALKKHSEKT